MRRQKKTAAGDDAASWSRYWASGALHSCTGAFRNNYDDEIRDFWTGFFGGLPGGARVLDIGTGNGAIACLALETANNSGLTFEIEGIDAAMINPALAARAHGNDIGRIVFHSAIPSEDTGFPDAHFDAVSSQYAIEYSRVGETIAELVRILKPGGVAAFVMHHADSEALVTARAELKVFEFLTSDANVIVPGGRFLRRLRFAHNPRELAERVADPESTRLRQEMDRSLNAIVNFARQQPHAGFAEDIARQFARLLENARAKGPDVGLEGLQILEDEMNAHQARLRAICKAAQRPQDIEKFSKLAASAGFEVGDPAEIRRGGKDLLGWALTVRRGS